jgi:hypothetical protein
VPTSVRIDVNTSASQLGHRRQPCVSDNARVGANALEQGQDREAVGGAKRVVRDDD